MDPTRRFFRTWLTRGGFQVLLAVIVLIIVGVLYLVGAFD